EADRFGLMAMDLATGAVREIAPDWDRSADGIVLSADGATLYTGAQDVGEHPLFAVDIQSGEVTEVIGDGSIGSFSIAGPSNAFTRASLKSGNQVFTGGIGGAPERAITPSASEMLPDVDFGDYEQFTFTGWNDETVHGYVVKPWNYQEGKRYPVAFLIHGGPQGSFGNSWSYRWNPQTYAGQGYAVVMIDFHGSTGYGQAFTDAISQHWGDRPLEDLKKGWAAAQQQYRFLDGDNACALGASYGGYMVNWIAGNWNEPWKCLVNHDGVFDTRMMGYATEELWFTEWENGGTPYDNPEAYERFNPINHVKDWRVPMLVIHGELDYRIPVSQGIAAFTALQRQGIESKFLYFPDENHWVLQPANSLLWHRPVNGWLRQHLGQSPMAPTTALLTNDAVALGLLAATLGLIFWTASRPTGFWQKFYSYVPALLMCYLVPAIYNSIGLVDGNASGLYPMARDYLLPSSLVLLCIAIDMGAVLRLGPKAVIMFLVGTAGVMLGAVVAFLAMGAIHPEAVAGDTWRGMTTVAGSW